MRDAAGKKVERAVQKSNASAFLIDKGNHRHFMAKEIHEQPEVVGHTLAHYLDMSAERVRMPALPFDFAKINRISISACGTAYYAGLVAKYWFERFARLPVEIDVASEFRYREAPFSPGGLAIFVSQSGETADTLATLRYAKEQKQHILSIVNVPTSTIARESDVVMPTLAGPEIGVASTKAFTCQLAALCCLAIARRPRARHPFRGRRAQAGARADRGAAPDDRGAGDGAAASSNWRTSSRTAATCSISAAAPRYPIALEGALKLKEISYIHAEGYAAGELKHGPIALIDENMPVIVIAPHDRVFEKTVSNMQEVAARGGRIILVTDPKGAARGDRRIAGDADAAGDARDRDAAGLRDPGAADRLPYGRDDGHGRRPAAQPGQIRDRRMSGCNLVRHCAVSQVAMAVRHFCSYSADP